MINILIISDSTVDRALVQNFLEKKQGIHVINSVGDKLELLLQLNPDEIPDVILVIKNNNKDNLINVVQFLHQLYNAPTIVCANDGGEMHLLNNAIFYPKISLRPTNQNFNPWLEELLNQIKKATLQYSKDIKQKSKFTFSANKAESIKTIPKKIKLIAMGASTGGPQTLNKIFSSLPAELNVPIVVVQHMPKNFLPIMIEWLKGNCPFTIEIAEKGKLPLPKHIYFAPDQFHLVLDSFGKFNFIDAPSRHNVKPSVSFLFESVANVYGDKALGILLTGMGKDGAKELALMKEAGAITIAQSEESCIVFGMPKEAIRLNGATFILSPEKMVQKIKEIFQLH